MKSLAFFCTGVAVTILIFYLLAPRPTYTATPTGWKLEHVPMPVCPDDHKRTIDAPERDEVDALSVTCEKR